MDKRGSPAAGDCIFDEQERSVMRCEVCIAYAPLRARDFLYERARARTQRPVIFPSGDTTRGKDLEEHKTCVHHDRTAITSREDGPHASRRTTGPGLDSMRATSTSDRPDDYNTRSREGHISPGLRTLAPTARLQVRVLRQPPRLSGAHRSQAGCMR